MAVAYVGLWIFGVGGWYDQGFVEEWHWPLMFLGFYGNTEVPLDTAQSIDDMDIPGFRLHPLKGRLKGRSG